MARVPAFRFRFLYSRSAAAWRALAATITAAVIPTAGSISLALAQGAPAPPLPTPPANVVAAKAYGTLERSCAGCHQAGRLEGRKAGAGIANILAIDEVARDPALVQPGVPDASRIYTVALTREHHLDLFNDPAVVEPSALEVQALRDWIGELPQATRGTCAARPWISPADIHASAEAVLASMSPEAGRQARFLSLAHLYNACVSDTELEGLRAGILGMLVGLAHTGNAPAGAAFAVDPARLVYPVSLTALGWRAEQWDKLVELYPLRQSAAGSATPPVRNATGTAVAVVPADWFAHTVQRVLGGAFERISADYKGARLWGHTAPEALAHAWERPAGPMRVTADLGLPRGASLESLPGYDGLRDGLGMQQLRGGGTARRARLDILLPGLISKPEPAGYVELADRLEIALAADKAAYKTGDVATFTVAVSRDCYLTLVGVDKGGRATVLFPNELAADNRVQGGTALHVPGDKAAYRFRFKDKGRETIVAICSQSQTAPEGIVHDYDRLRFTVLGDWQLFLREPPEMKEARRDDAATDVPRPQQRQRRRGRQGAPAATPGPSSPDVQTRTAITIDIE